MIKILLLFVAGRAGLAFADCSMPAGTKGRINTTGIKQCQLKFQSRFDKELLKITVNYLLFYQTSAGKCGNADGYLRLPDQSAMKYCTSITEGTPQCFLFYKTGNGNENDCQARLTANHGCHSYKLNPSYLIEYFEGNNGIADSGFSVDFELINCKEPTSTATTTTTEFELTSKSVSSSIVSSPRSSTTTSSGVTPTTVSVTTIINATLKTTTNVSTTGQNDPAIIAAISVICILLLLILITVFVIFMKRKRRHTPADGSNRDVARNGHAGPLYASTRDPESSRKEHDSIQSMQPEVVSSGRADHEYDTLHAHSAHHSNDAYSTISLGLESDNLNLPVAAVRDTQPPTYDLLNPKWKTHEKALCTSSSEYRSIEPATSTATDDPLYDRLDRGADVQPSKYAAVGESQGLRNRDIHSARAVDPVTTQVSVYEDVSGPGIMPDVTTEEPAEDGFDSNEFNDADNDNDEEEQGASQVYSMVRKSKKRQPDDI